MRANKPTQELEEISESECMDILARHTIGRIAISVGGRPEIFPVNYGMGAGMIVFRTSLGTKLSYSPESHVAFEVDDYDASTGLGWSVLVQGIARDVTDAGDDFSWAARGVELHSLMPGATHMIAIEAGQITGRRAQLSS
ncbi:MAG: pyridoxamine 5'-phosphate oxidase family protein [Actinomycetota bacterium]|nr:pyridoxamine 5'-phosphate oxidase family protein [Candidatus Dormibacteraeota bacterium]MDQ6945864.1 pyridoxamine 5'-phosphate oxidase family protein [Actinomycetota bacterium]